MAALIIINLLRNEEGIRRRELRLFNRHLRDAANPFELPNFNFMKLFRLNKEAATYLINTVEPYMHDVIRNSGIPNYLKILCAVHFFGHGSYELDAGHGGNFGLSQPSVSRCINGVTRVINDRLLNTWIHFPRTDQEINHKIQIFFNKYRFPNAIGAIDGTHVAIFTPPRDHPIYPAAPYLNRKGFYSINVQIIVDAHLNILNMNARFPGSVHDAAIWMMSNISRHLRNHYFNEDMNWHLIGDEGYPLSPWLLVQYPGNVNANSPQGRYNSSLRQSRNCVETLNGRLKGRFRCLLKDRVLHYNPVKVAKIIYSCGVLHNICSHFGAPWRDQENIENDENVHFGNNNAENNYFLQGQRKKDAFTARYFN